MLRNKLKNWHSKLRHPWRSTETSTDASSASLPPLQEVIRSSATFHTSAYTLPIGKYFDLVVEESLEHLIIEGVPNVLELQDAFERIISEIAGIMHNDKTDAMVKISKRIGMLQADIIYINYSLEYLRKLFALHGTSNPDICTELRRMGYDYRFDPANAYQYKRELTFVESRAKTLLQQRKDLLKEYERMTSQGPNSSKKKRGREDYETEITELSAFQGYKLDKTSTMTSEYFAVLSRYNKAVKAQQKQKEGSHGRR